MADPAAAAKDDKTKALHSALFNSIVFQVIIVLLSVAAMNDYTGRISVVALAGYWAPVLLRLFSGDSAKLSAVDLHFLRWGYFWAYCLVVLAYYVLVQLGWK